MSKISSKELFVFTFFLGVILFPGFGNTLVLETGRHAALFSSFVGFLIGFIPLLMIVYIIDKANDKNIFEYNKEKFKWFGQILNILYVIAIIYIIFVESWSIVTFTVSQFLSRTSYYLILALLSTSLSLVVCKKLEVIGRCHIILFLLFMLIILFAWIFLIPIVEFDNYLPIFDVSYEIFIKTSLMFPTFIIVPLISLISIRKSDITDSKKLKRRIICGYIFGYLFVFVFLLLIIGVFGIDMSIIFTYPEYALLKKVQAFDFIQRIENVLASTIIIASFTSLAVLLYSLITYVKTTFKIKKDLILNIITVFLCFAIPLISITLFKNYLIINLFTKFPIYSSFIYIVLFINFILIVLCKKKSATKS